MGSAGEDVKDYAKKFADDPLGETVNIATNLGTYGILGYDSESGNFGGGVTTHAVDEGIGQVTGRNLARDQNAAAETRLNAEDAARQQELLSQQAYNEQSDRNASFAARGARRTAASKSGGSSFNFGSQDEQDFLGL